MKVIKLLIVKLQRINKFILIHYRLTEYRGERDKSHFGLICSFYRKFHAELIGDTIMFPCLFIIK